MNFYIKQNSILPNLKMKLYMDGRLDYKKFHDLLENATVTFSMKNINNGTFKIINKESQIVEVQNGDNTEYYLQYTWNQNDTLESGQFEGQFRVDFLDDCSYIIVPVREKLYINILSSFTKAEIQENNNIIESEGCLIYCESGSNFTGGTVSGSTEFLSGVTVNGLLDLCDGELRVSTINGCSPVVIQDNLIVEENTLSGKTAFFDEIFSGNTNLNNLFSNIDENIVSGELIGSDLILNRENGDTIIVTGFTSNIDIYTTGVTISGNTLIFNRNDNDFYQIDLTPILSDDNTFITGGTFNNNILTLERNDNVNIDITGFTDFYTTGVTWDGINTATFSRNDGDSYNLTIDDLHINNFSANTISSGNTNLITIIENISSQYSANTFTTSSVLSGTTAIFSRNDGNSYNLDLSTIDGNLTINGNINVTGEGEGFKLYGENFIFVPTTKNSTMYDPITNGTNLTTAYADAITKTPNGLPLSESNRYTVLLAPGVYNLPQPLTASTEYVDLVSMTGEKDVFLSATTTPLLVLTDNIKLVGLSVYEYDFIILSEFRNVIVENCGNRIFTMDRNTRSEKKYYYYLWDALSGEPNPFTGLINILYYDYASPKGRNKAVSFNLNGGINLLKSFVSSKFNGSGSALMDGIDVDGVGSILGVEYDSLVGTLNVGDELVFDGTGSLIGEILAIQGSVIYMSETSGQSNADETTFTDTDTSATANVTSISPQGFPLNPTGYSNIINNIGSNYMTINIYQSVAASSNNGPNVSIDLDSQPTYYVGYISFSGNPASFIGDDFITNDLGGTAQISEYYGTGVILSDTLTGQWENATTIQGNNTLNICNITEFSSETEYNFMTEIIFDFAIFEF